MGWSRDVRGGIGAGMLTTALFGAAPAAMLLSWAPIPTSVLVAEERPAALLAFDDIEQAGVFELSPAPPVRDGAPAEAPAQEAQTRDEAGDEAGDEPPVAPIPGTQTGGTERSTPTEAARRSPHDPGEVRQGVEATIQAKESRRRRRCEVDPIPEIARSGAASWTVDRSLIRRYTLNFKALNALGWSRRHDGPDGRPDGMLIGGIRCNNDLYRAGIRSGDVVHTVNAHKVRNIAQAVLVYSKVHNDRLIRVEITRRGQRRILTYRLTG
ncbi:MAG TPA: hypothetical protein ENK18_16260 [Deltaproteobacteria bacterium]|nr:hypothetical protein [Deltaproteobacteria bacterium]